MRWGLALAAALLLAGCGTHGRSGGRDHRAAAPLRGAASLSSRFAGVAQRGAELGPPRAPYTLLEFVDLQCPYCARFDRDVLPTLVERFVRPGKLRLELRPVRLLGPDSQPGANAALAAARQDRLWQFADLFYRNQGAENSGYVTPAFIRRIAAGVPGLDPARLRRDMTARAVATTLDGNERSARTAGIEGTPNFRVGPTGGVLLRFDGHLLERGDFVSRLAAVLR
jgi:protein-disulfide isomerase